MRRAFDASPQGRAARWMPAALTAMIVLLGSEIALAKAPDSAVEFGDTIEVTINRRDSRLVDFDTGKTSAFPRHKLAEWNALPTKDEGKQALYRWVEEQGIDAFGESPEVILGLDFIAIPARTWDVQPAHFDDLDYGKPGSPIPITGYGELPATYLFETREGGRGVLQILSFEPGGVRLRFKLKKAQSK